MSSAGRGRGRVLRVVCATALAVCGVACPSEAQQAGVWRGEIGVAALLTGALPLGSVPATLTRPDGGALVVFTTDNRLRPSRGLEVQASYRATPRLAVEAVSGWTAVDLESRVGNDLEGAAAATLSQAVSRFTVEGAVLWSVNTGERLSLFVRGSGGWMREVTRGVGLVADGGIGSAGVGVKYWWGGRSSRPGRVALRLEGRAVARSGGLLLGTDSLRIMPAAVAGLIVGF
jgi:hypothetical protein